MQLKRQKFNTIEELNNEIEKYISNGYLHTNNHLVHPEIDMVIRINPKTLMFYKKSICTRKTGYNNAFKCVSWNGDSSTYMQRLRWELFVGPIPKGHTVMFKDGDSTNAKLSNLDCVSRVELSSITMRNTRKKHGAEWGNWKDREPYYYCFETEKVYQGLANTYKALNLPYSGSAITNAINKAVRYKKHPKNGKVYSYVTRSVHGYTFRRATPEEIQEWKDNND